MYEMQGASPVQAAGSGTIRKNPSQVSAFCASLFCKGFEKAKKYVLDDGSELSSDQVIKLTASVTEAKAEAEVLKAQNAYLLSFLK
jgi:hypothetical protein